MHAFATPLLFATPPSSMPYEFLGSDDEMELRCVRRSPLFSCGYLSRHNTKTEKLHNIMKSRGWYTFLRHSILRELQFEVRTVIWYSNVGFEKACRRQHVRSMKVDSFLIRGPEHEHLFKGIFLYSRSPKCCKTIAHTKYSAIMQHAYFLILLLEILPKMLCFTKVVRYWAPTARSQNKLGTFSTWG